MFLALLHVFLAKQIQLDPRNSALGEKGGVVRAPRGVLHKFHVFVELHHGKVCGALPNSPKNMLYASEIEEGNELYKD